MRDSIYRYDACISYRHLKKDCQWAKWLHSALERYKAPILYNLFSLKQLYVLLKYKKSVPFVSSHFM